MRGLWLYLTLQVFLLSPHRKIEGFTHWQCTSVCLFTRLSVCLFVCLSVCLSPEMPAAAGMCAAAIQLAVGGHTMGK